MPDQQLDLQQVITDAPGIHTPMTGQMDDEEEEEHDAGLVAQVCVYTLV
jgi:hypothetical protein